MFFREVGPSEWGGLSPQAVCFIGSFVIGWLLAGIVKLPSGLSMKFHKGKR